MQISKMVLKLSVALATGLMALSAHATECNAQSPNATPFKSPSEVKKEQRQAKATVKSGDATDVNTRR